MSCNINRVFYCRLYLSTTIIPPAVTAGLQHFILVILSSFLVYLHQFLPSDLAVKNPLEVLRRLRHLSSLRLGKFLLLSLPFLPALGKMNANTAGPKVSATDVAGHEGWRHDCVGSQSVSQSDSRQLGQWSPLLTTAGCC